MSVVCAMSFPVKWCCCLFEVVVLPVLPCVLFVVCRTFLVIPELTAEIDSWEENSGQFHSFACPALWECRLFIRYQSPRYGCRSKTREHFHILCANMSAFLILTISWSIVIEWIVLQYEAAMNNIKVLSTVSEWSLSPNAIHLLHLAMYILMLIGLYLYYFLIHEAQVIFTHQMKLQNSVGVYIPLHAAMYMCNPSLLAVSSDY